MTDYPWRQRVPRVFAGTMATVMGALAVDLEWIALLAVPVLAVSTFNFVRWIKDEREWARLHEAQTWSLLAWHTVLKAKGDAEGRYRCPYCGAEWQSGEGHDSAPHTPGCHGRQIWAAIDGHEAEWSTWREEQHERLRQEYYYW